MRKGEQVAAKGMAVKGSVDPCCYNDGQERRRLWGDRWSNAVADRTRAAGDGLG